MISWNCIYDDFSLLATILTAHAIQNDTQKVSRVDAFAKDEVITNIRDINVDDTYYIYTQIGDVKYYLTDVTTTYESDTKAFASSTIKENANEFHIDREGLYIY